MEAPLRHLPKDMFRRMPWKNGGGETIEVAVYPAQATLEDFVYRISMARVVATGAFSCFPGIDRTLCVLERFSFNMDRKPALTFYIDAFSLGRTSGSSREPVPTSLENALEGECLGVQIAGRDMVWLDSQSAPFSFPADVPVIGQVNAPGILDLNVMTRRGVAHHHVSRERISETRCFPRLSPRTILLLAEGAARLETAGSYVDLSAGDAAQWISTPELQITPTRAAVLYVIDLWVDGASGA